MTIKLDDLKSAGACAAAMRAFAKAFPDGAPSVAAIGDHPDCRPSWRAWLAINMPQCDRETGLRLLRGSDNPLFWNMHAAKAHWCDRETARKLLDKSHASLHWRATVLKHHDPDGALARIVG